MGVLEREKRAQASDKFERRKEAIVRAAVEPLNSKGVRGMTLAEVAAKLDIVPTAVSYYFRRKEELAAACYLHAIARYEAMIDAASEEPTAEAALRRFNREFAEYLRAVDTGEADPIAVFNDVRAIHDPAVDAAYTNMFRRIRAAFSKEAAGPLDRLERNARAHLVLSQTFWATVWLRGYEPADYVRMIERMSDILLLGLAGPNSAWAPCDLPPADETADLCETSREPFLRAATELVNEHGYHGASVAKISARLNVTKGSFYHHNPAKDDLVAHCFHRTLQILRRSQEAADRLAQSGLDNLASVAATLVRREVSGEAPLLRTSALTAVPQDIRDQLICRFDRASARFASVVSDGIADGSIRPVDANVAAQMISATINAGAELRYWAPGITPDEAIRAYVRPLFVGLKAANCT